MYIMVVKGYIGVNEGQYQVLINVREYSTDIKHELGSLSFGSRVPIP